ncbi:DUF6544 family protein [Actibacterium lipolyticum]|uniref:Uncharacterized protein n=1 Tax=Actibacterium lipolyticum TaxID=1524263 RepID=A0A238JNC9_9RHOB|nr:DUF6544 family protein [Actibacterium lipolyticum]SMX31286.1 hypothetical protein COL8621_00371 [Actibacterium lipolyticum]
MKILLGLIGVVIAAVLCGSIWRVRVVERLRDTVLTDDLPSAAVPSLPPIIEAFAAKAGSVRGDLASQIAMSQSAEIRRGKGADFMMLTADHLASVGHTAFVWNARVPIGPFSAVRVIDSFTAGTGSLQVWLLGALRVGNATGPWLNKGEAMRYLAELPWFPDAILGNPALRWQVVYADRVRVSTSVGNEDVAVEFLFNAAGDIVEMHAKDRPDDVGGTTVLRDWRGYYRDYGEINGRRIPLSAEVGYDYPDGYEAYFFATVTDYTLTHRD